MIAWTEPSLNEHILCYIVWVHTVLIARALIAPQIWECQKGWIKKWEEEKRFINKFICNVWYRALDFSATVLSIGIFVILTHSSPWPVRHFFHVGVILIALPFEFYIVRFKRYKELLSALFLQERESPKPLGC